MPAVSRQGDTDTGGGVMQSGTPSVLVNGKQCGVTGKAVSGHGRGPHSAPSVQQGSSSVFAEGKPVTYVGATDSCGHTRSQGSPDVYVGS